MELDISPEFEKALNIMEDTNESLFVTGNAGTGKSVLLRHFRENSKKKVVVLAPTGLAAINVIGKTIHKFFGFGINITFEKAKQKAEYSYMKNKQAFSWIDTIIIDEISMVRSDLLDCIDIFLKYATGKQIPFAGIQMVFFGDLFQLPPIVTDKEKSFFNIKTFGNGYSSPYFFDARVFKYLILNNVIMKKIYRQDDQTFINILNGVRKNKLSSRGLAKLNNRYNDSINIMDLEEGYIYLATTNKIVGNLNHAKLNELSTEKYVLRAEIKGDFDEKEMPTDEVINIKVGAQIMMIVNDIDGRWVNGSLGVIQKLELDDAFEQDYPIVCVTLYDTRETWEITRQTWKNSKMSHNKDTDTLESKDLGEFTQFPFKLAYALTIHKVQGKTFDKVMLDMGWGAFTTGQTYVALSRCTSLEGLLLKKPIKQSDIKVDPIVVKFEKEYYEKIEQGVKV